MAWNPLDDGFLTSTVLSLGPTPVAIWAMLIASADRHGNSKLTPIAAAALLRIKDEEAIKAFAQLSAPDKNSRNQDDDGRRIRKNEDGTWHLNSHDKYRKLTSRAAAVARQQAYRERHPGRKAAGLRGDQAARASAVTEPTPDGEHPGAVWDPGENHRRRNPLVDRLRLEPELLALAKREADLTDRDAAEVLSEISHYEGARRTAINPSSMSDDRLMNSVLDGRKRVRDIEARLIKIGKLKPEDATVRR